MNVKQNMFLGVPDIHSVSHRYCSIMLPTRLRSMLSGRGSCGALKDVNELVHKMRVELNDELKCAVR